MGGAQYSLGGKTFSEMDVRGPGLASDPGDVASVKLNMSKDPSVPVRSRSHRPDLMSSRGQKSVRLQTE